MCSSYVSGDRGYSGDSSALTDYYEHESQNTDTKWPRPYHDAAVIVKLDADLQDFQKEIYIGKLLSICFHY